MSHKVRLLRLWQFDLIHLFLFSTALSLGIAWVGESYRTVGIKKENERPTKLDSRLAVNAILNGGRSREQKAEALADFVKLGDRLEDVFKWADFAAMSGFHTGPLHWPMTKTVLFADTDLVVDTVNGRVVAIGRADESGGEWIVREEPGSLPTD
jgi:hypothetical protein